MAINEDWAVTFLRDLSPTLQKQAGLFLLLLLLLEVSLKLKLDYFSTHLDVCVFYANCDEQRKERNFRFEIISKTKEEEKSLKTKSNDFVSKSIENEI